MMASSNIYRCRLRIQADTPVKQEIVDFFQNSPESSNSQIELIINSFMEIHLMHQAKWRGEINNYQANLPISETLSFIRSGGEIVSTSKQPSEVDQTSLPSNENPSFAVKENKKEDLAAQLRSSLSSASVSEDIVVNMPNSGGSSIHEQESAIVSKNENPLSDDVHEGVGESKTVIDSTLKNDLKVKLAW